MRYFRIMRWCLWGCLTILVLLIGFNWWFVEYGPKASYYAGQRGEVAFKRHDYAIAERYYRKAGYRYRSWHAASLIRCGRPQDVKALYAEPFDHLTPEDDAVRGVAELELGRPDVALPMLEKAVSRQPNLPMHHLNLSIALERLGKQDAARQERAKAVNLGGPKYRQWYCPIATRLEVY